MLVALLGGALLAQDANDPATELLARARQAQAQKDHTTAASRFRQFLNRFPQHANAPAARQGLALALIDGPTRDYKAALDQLQLLAGAKDPTVLFYLGWCHRGLGQPAEALPHFVAAAQGFAARVRGQPKDDALLPADLEAATGARCCQAEMLLRQGKTAEARDFLAALLKDRALMRSRCRPLALYYHGYANLALKDNHVAGRSLSQLAAVEGLPFSGHAHYLLAQVHHRDDELAEASRLYEAAVAEHETHRAKVVEALAQNPPDRERLEALLKGPPPGYISEARFSLALLAYEAGRFADADARLDDLLKQDPRSPLAAPGRLVRGMSLVHLERFGEAVPLLESLVKDETLAAHALLWLGKAQAAAAPPDDPEKRPMFVRAAVESLRRAIDDFKADPVRRTEAMLALAEILQQVQQYPAAADVLSHIPDSGLSAQRVEDLMQRRLTALCLAGDHAAALQRCDRFLQTYPKSAQRPEALFRRGESAFFLGRLDEAARAYQEVIDKYPDYGHASAARYGLAWTHYRKDEFEKTRTMLESIAPPDRAGELAFVPYLLADCLLRTAPARADDALAAGKLSEELTRAAGLLTDFVAAQPDDPAAGDALLRLGLCQQRLAPLAGKPEERDQLRQASRDSYERVLIEYPLHELQPFAAFARSRGLAATGDPGQAIARLRNFHREPLNRHPIAPLALLCRATLLRGIENGAADAARIMADCRRQHEQALLADKTRAAWVPLLQYHHGVALKEAGRFPEARAVFEALMRQYPERPQAIESALRLGQALNDEGWQRIDRANQALGQPNLKPAEVETLQKMQQEGNKLVHAALQWYENQAELWGQRRPEAEARAWMLYEAAWLRRHFAEEEVEAARNRRKAELHEKLKKEAAKNSPAGQQPPDVPVPDVPLADIPLQPSEKKARAHYQVLIAGFTDLPLALDARLEFAELLLERNDQAAAVKILNECLDKEPLQELTDKVRLRLGMIDLARGDVKAALARFDAVSVTPNSPLVGHGHYRAAECLLRLGDTAGAVKRLALFRDVEALHGIGGASDIALLRLGQSYGRLRQWNDSRRANEVLLERFGDGNPWSAQAHYCLGWALLKLKDPQNARQHFRAAAGDAVNELAAKAHVLIGATYGQQSKRYADALKVLQEVPERFDQFPDFTALALLEAAHVARLSKQNDRAEQLLKRVIDADPKGAWAKIARERQKDMKAAIAPHELPAAQKLLTPDLAEPPDLDNLGGQRDGRAPLDDPTDEAAQAWLLARLPRPRTMAAPPLASTNHDPFIHRQALPIHGPLPVGPLPLIEDLRLVRP